MSIRYRPIQGFPGYRADTDGGIWSAWRHKGMGYGRKGGHKYISNQWKLLKPTGSRGRPRYTLKNAAGKYVRKFGSQIILETFVGPCPEGQEACHNNGDKSDNHLTNLRWDTHLKNIQDKYRHRTMHYKLTPEEVETIISSPKSYKELANEFGITAQYVGHLKRYTLREKVEMASV